PRLAEHCDHFGHVLVRRLFKADLTINAVIAQAKVGRASYAAMHGLRLHCGQQCAAVAYAYVYSSQIHLLQNGIASSSSAAQSVLSFAAGVLATGTLSLSATRWAFTSGYLADLL